MRTQTKKSPGPPLQNPRAKSLLIFGLSMLTVSASAGCAVSDSSALGSSLERYAELSSRQFTDSWPVEFGEVLSGDALAAAEAGYLLLAEAGFSQAGSIAFKNVEILAPGEAVACLDMTDSLIVDQSGGTLQAQPSEVVQLGYQRMGGAVKISEFELVGEYC